jgi:subtilisin family serine protease
MGVLVRKTFKCIFLSAVLFLTSADLTSLSQTTPAKKYWVYFRDKGPESTGSQSLHKGLRLYEVARATLADRTLKRRAKVMSANSLIDANDLPVYQPYLDELAKLGMVPHISSRWFNAVSTYLTEEQVRSIASLPFVKDVIAVVAFHRRKEPVEVIDRGLQRRSAQKAEQLDYGSSFEQVNLINVPAVHSLGINGTGVLIGMLDAGFRWKNHNALDSLRVIAEYDFIFHDSVTANESDDAPDQDSHGTATLSAIGGFEQGQLIGPAYGASFILGKTEYIPSETQIEEDNWVAGIEWMESRGVDVVSSSLGYTTFDDGAGYLYSQGDFNGRTAVTTKAAVMAARKGVVVVNSMGNEGNTVGSIIAPADADSIISAGAVNYSGALASFSSVGPTNDGRTKPDVVAPGVSIYVASTFGGSAYGRASGTSFSCPLTAGVAALVLSAHPEFTPIQVRDVIRNTASRADRPDNFYGWGLIDVRVAVLSSGLVFSNLPHLYYNDLANIVTTYAASKSGVDNLGFRLLYSLDGGKTFASLPMLPTDTANLFLATVPTQAPGTPVQYYIEGIDQAGIQRRSPPTSPDSLFSFRYGEGDTSRLQAKPIPTTVPTTFVLYQNYPNPFNPSTTIQFYSPEFTDGEVVIYNVLGEKVKTITPLGGIKAGNNFVVWEPGLADEPAASGVYFYQLRTPAFTDTKRMLLIK